MKQYIAFVRFHTETKAKPRKGEGRYLWRVTLEGKPARKIVELLYKNSEMGLDRNSKIAKDILNRFEMEESESVLQERFLELRRQGVGRSIAIKSIGKSYKTLNKWMSNSSFVEQELSIDSNSSVKTESEKIEEYFGYRKKGIGRDRSAKMAQFSYKTILRLIRENEGFAKREAEIERINEINKNQKKKK